MIAAAPAVVATGAPRHHYIAFALMMVLAVAAPFQVYPVFLAKLLCFALFACAFNLLIGFVGLLSFGHAAFWGTAAYASAQAAARWGLGAELSILFGVAVAAFFGLVIGGLAIRRQGIYFAMVTLAFAQMVFFLAVQASFTGGEDGLQIPSNVPRVAFGILNLRDNLTLYWFVLGVFVLGFLLIYRIVHSPFGQVLKAIRENEPRAVSLGYHVTRYKLVAFVLSAALAGLAGGTKVFVAGSAALTDVNWPMSGEVVLMALLGGMGTIFGPVAGAVVLITIEEFLAERAGAWVSVIQGGIFVLCVLAFRRGIIGEIARAIKKPL
ncbi:MAG: branched-chain amino acid ABC transporter permease [Rhodospirillaceae bacterium]|nr:branched-chain amino acid ABC transporter permease [Rhodospirillaceae bacterium]